MEGNVLWGEEKILEEERLLGGLVVKWKKKEGGRN